MSEQRNEFDLIVIGGGVIGLSCAWRAARAGLSVVVLDRDTPGSGTSRVAAGMLAPVAEADFGEAQLLALGMRSAELYSEFVVDLEHDSACRVDYRRFGTLLVAHDNDQAAVLERERDFREGLGLAVERLTPTQARAAEPGLAPRIRSALRFPDDHAVDPRAMCTALVVAISALGGEVRTGASVAAVDSNTDRVTGVRLEDGRSLAANHVLLSAGVWSAGIAGLPDQDSPRLRPVKGQLLVLRDPAGPGLLETVLRTEEVYVAPRDDGRYIVGATSEERGFDTSVTAGAVHDLLRHASDVLPGVLEFELVESLAGLRPCTPDNAPLIGAGSLEGLLIATGHYRHGVLLAPITAQAVRALLLGEEPDPLCVAFAPARFGARAPA